MMLHNLLAFPEDFKLNMIDGHGKPELDTKDIVRVLNSKTWPTMQPFGERRGSHEGRFRRSRT